MGSTTNICPRGGQTTVPGKSNRWQKGGTGGGLDAILFCRRCLYHTGLDRNTSRAARFGNHQVECVVGYTTTTTIASIYYSYNTHVCRCSGFTRSGRFAELVSDAHGTRSPPRVFVRVLVATRRFIANATTSSTTTTTIDAALCFHRRILSTGRTRRFGESAGGCSRPWIGGGSCGWCPKHGSRRVTAKSNLSVLRQFSTAASVIGPGGLVLCLACLFVTTTFRRCSIGTAIRHRQA